MKLNLNDTVKVKITPFGIKILEDDYNKLREYFPSMDDKFTPPEVDNEGYSKMQLHDVMQRFGSYMHLGAREVPIEMNLIIKDK